MLPAVVSQLVVVVKDTALGGILVGYSELRRAGSISASNYGNLLPTYFVIAVIYIVINLLLGNLSTLVERKLRTRRGGPVVEIEAGAQTDLMAARQEILVLDEPGSASVMPQQERGFDSRP
jgi:glutamate transport system permease protein